MGPLKDPISEMLARLTAIDRLVRHTLLAMDRLAADLGRSSPIEDIVALVAVTDAVALPLKADELLEWERATHLIGETLVDLRHMRAALAEAGIGPKGTVDPS